MTMIQDSGIDEILRNLNVAMESVGHGIENGLKRAGNHIQAKSQEIVPVNLGVLKNTAYTRSKWNDEYTEVFVGYTADYAVYVHENLNALHGAEYNAAYSGTTNFKSRGENQQAKFLEKPMREEQRVMLNLIEDSIIRFMRKMVK